MEDEIKARGDKTPLAWLADENRRLTAALQRIRNIKSVIPFDAADAATECIRIAKEAHWGRSEVSASRPRRHASEEEGREAPAAAAPEYQLACVRLDRNGRVSPESGRDAQGEPERRPIRAPIDRTGRKSSICRIHIPPHRHQKHGTFSRSTRRNTATNY